MSGTNTTYNFLIIFFVALGSFTYGFNSAISGSVIGLSSFLNYFNLTTSGPWLLDRCGRRLAIQTTCVICIISAVIQAASVHTAMLLIGRFINGIGVGMIDVAVPIYQSEISPATVR